MRATMGVEEEFLLVDGDSGALVPRSDQVVPFARETLADAVTSELNLCQIEGDTPVCMTLSELRDELKRLRHGLASGARLAGTAIAPLASHPFSRWAEQEVDRTNGRYARMADRFGIIAEEQVICGCHVHVGLGDRETEVEVMTRSRPWLAVLVALAANSPYWEGRDTGYDSYRAQVWRRWPTAGLPPALSSRAEYDTVVDRLVKAGAVDDATQLYWYARPSARFPTLEFRMADVCLTVDETVAVAGLVRALAWTFANTPPPPGPSPAPAGVLDSAIWRAARFGLSDKLVCPEDGCPRPAPEIVCALLQTARPGLEAHGDWETVTDLVQRILRDGNGAQRQRHAMRASGPRGVVAMALEAGLP